MQQYGSKYLLALPNTWCGERNGSVVECLNRDRRAASSSLTGVTAFWSLSKTQHVLVWDCGITWSFILVSTQRLLFKRVTHVV